MQQSVDIAIAYRQLFLYSVYTLYMYIYIYIYMYTTNALFAVLSRTFIWNAITVFVNRQHYEKLQVASVYYSVCICRAMLHSPLVNTHWLPTIIR